MRYPTKDDMENGIDVHMTDNIPWGSHIFSKVKKLDKYISSIYARQDAIGEKSSTSQDLCHGMRSVVDISAVSHEINPSLAAKKLHK